MGSISSWGWGCLCWASRSCFGTSSITSKSNFWQFEITLFDSFILGKILTHVSIGLINETQILRRNARGISID